MITRLLNSHHTTLSFPHHTSYFTPRATIRAILQPFNTYLLIHALQTLVHYSLYFNKLISNRSQRLIMFLLRISESRSLLTHCAGHRHGHDWFVQDSVSDFTCSIS